MSESAFEGFADDLDDIIPDRIPDDVYKCKLEEISVAQKAANEPRWLIIKWVIIEEGDFYGEEIGPEIFRVFNKDEFEKANPDEKAKLRKTRRDRLARLESLGVSKDKLAETDPNDLKGLEAFVTVKVRSNKDGKYQHWISNVELASSVEDNLGEDFTI